MKKAIFLLLAIGVTTFGIYACQKDNTAKTLQSITSNTAVSDRADYSDCSDCAENCTDCCLELTCTTPNITFGFVNPATGFTTYRAFITPGTVTVCAAGGYVAIIGNGAGTIKVCSTGDTKSKLAGAPNFQGTLTWDCHL